MLAVQIEILMNSGNRSTVSQCLNSITCINTVDQGDLTLIIDTSTIIENVRKEEDAYKSFVTL